MDASEENDVPGWLSRGTITMVDPKTFDKKELEVTDFVKANYKDGREISLITAEDDSVFLEVTNPEGSGRNPEQILRLSPESLIGVLSTAFIYYSAKNIDMGQELQKALAASAEQIHFQFSDNLQLPQTWNKGKDAAQPE